MLSILCILVLLSLGLYAQPSVYRFSPQVTCDKCAHSLTLIVQMNPDVYAPGGTVAFTEQFANCEFWQGGAVRVVTGWARETTDHGFSSVECNFPADLLVGEVDIRVDFGSVFGATPLDTAAKRTVTTIKVLESPVTKPGGRFAFTIFPAMEPKYLFRLPILKIIRDARWVQAVNPLAMPVPSPGFNELRWLKCMYYEGVQQYLISVSCL
jgi:hypothetical protein